MKDVSSSLLSLLHLCIHHQHKLLWSSFTAITLSASVQCASALSEMNVESSISTEVNTRTVLLTSTIWRHDVLWRTLNGYNLNFSQCYSRFWPLQKIKSIRKCVMVLLVIMALVLVLVETVMGFNWSPCIRGLLKPINPNGICPKAHYRKPFLMVKSWWFLMFETLTFSVMVLPFFLH